MLGRRFVFSSLALNFLLNCSAFGQSELDQSVQARDIIQASIDLWRGTSSVSEMTMTIHRPDWERSMSLRAWTQGEDNSLVRVTAPAADVGNATLMLDQEMWNFSPKINRVIKIPSSLMGQSWMGSDFTNKDVARADEIVDEYDHRMLEITEIDGRTVYRIESIPHESAAVVWGRQVIEIRDDHVMLKEDFYDQDDLLVKTLVTLEIDEMDGRMVAKRQRMSKREEPENWTEIEVHKAEYDVELPAALFTLANLRNPRE